MKKPGKKIIILLTVVGSLIIIGIASGFVIQWYINDTIDETQGVSGKVGWVLLNPLEGIYSVQDIDIAFTSEAVDVPVIKARRVSVNISWGQLLSGNIYGRIYINSPEIRQIVKLPAEDAPDPQGPPITRVFRNLAPLELDLVRLSQGTVVLRDQTRDVPFEIDFTEIEGHISNLTNSASLSDTLYATIEAKGIVKGTGALKIAMTLNPVAENLQYHLVMDIHNMQLTRFNDFVSELAGITFEKGTLSIHADIDADQGMIRGFIQSTYENMTILNPEANQNFLEQLRDAVAELLGEMAEDKENRIITRVPVDIKVRGTRPDVLVSVVDVIQQTIVRAVLPVVGELGGEVE